MNVDKSPVWVDVSAAANNFLSEIVRCRRDNSTEPFSVGRIHSRENIGHSGSIGADRRHSAGGRVIIE